jgi:hypothetical protein
MQCTVETSGHNRCQPSEVKVLHEDPNQCMLPIGVRGRLAALERLLAGLVAESAMEPAAGPLRRPDWWPRDMTWPPQGHPAPAPST